MAQVICEKKEPDKYLWEFLVVDNAPDTAKRMQHFHAAPLNLIFFEKLTVLRTEFLPVLRPAGRYKKKDLLVGLRWIVQANRSRN